MSNPFETPDASYIVLINGEGQYSLWPEFLSIPPGWERVFGAANRQECLDYINMNWDNLMPNSTKPIENISSRT